MDLTNPANWSVVYQANLRGNLIATYGQPGDGAGQLQIYDPIPDQQATLATPVGLVRTFAPDDEIKSSWYTGCWFVGEIDLVSGVDTRLLKKQCALNKATIIELPNLGKFPYKVTFRIPPWLISLRIELWQFTDQSGKYVPLEDSVVWTAVEVVEQRTQDLEQLIRQQQGGI